MSDQGPGPRERDPEHDDSPLPPGQRRRGCGLPGCLAVLVALAVLLGGGYFVVTRGVDVITDRLRGPEDYAGPGTGQVLVEVREGDLGSQIGQELKDKGVVKSVDAFVSAYNSNPDSAGIQVGFYQLKKKMKAEDAVAILVDPTNLIETAVTIPEGLRAEDTVGILAKHTKFPAARFEKVLDKPSGLGLPAYAQGNPEGYLFPATYAFPPNATPRSMLKAMVDRWHEAAAAADLAGATERLGYSEEELMTVASLVEAESTPTYMPKVARVIYNRLEDNSVTGGRLQLDATVNFAHGEENLGARTTEAERQIDSPYNTYRYPGLPPGPIESPGQAAIEAATQPADGPWFFYVTVNLRTGETKFAETLEEHARFVAELDEYCRTESERC